MINEFVKISTYLGGREDYVQGAGGNTSVKIDDSHMLIKASGSLLSDITQSYGYVKVNYSNIKKKLLLNDFSDNEINAMYSDEVDSNERDKKLKPSIETGFHALLKSSLVLHSHSVYSNILNCCFEGEMLVKELFPNSTWVEYGTPGKDLIRKFNDALKNQSETDFIFLANHGFFTGGEHANEVIRNHEYVTTKIGKYFNLEPFHSVNYELKDLKRINEKVLFPDQVVFLDPTLTHTKAAKQTMAAYCYIYNAMISLNLTPKFIPQEMVDRIVEMESEKYRKSQVK